MKFSRLFPLLFLALLAGTGCELEWSDDPSRQQCPDGRCPNLDPRSGRVDLTDLPPERSIILDLPVELRVKNYKGGSCVHASTSMVLHHQGLHDQAVWWRSTYAYGETDRRLMERVDNANLRFAATDQGDPAFLEWCSRTQRIATIFYKPAHSIVFMQYITREDGREYAKLLDNNRIDTYEFVPKEEFVRKWKGFGGFALTMLYNPPPPQLWR